MKLTPLVAFRGLLWIRLLSWMFVSIFLIFAGWLSSVAVLNYNGYCFEHGRYLTDEEQLQPLVRNVFLIYPKITYAYDELPLRGFEVISDKSHCCGQGDMSRYDKSRGGTAINAEQLILYRDMDEFLAINPDCCSFTREPLYGEISSTTLWDKITGYSAGFVNVKFRVRYRDAAGNVQSKFSAYSGNHTNCGIAVDPLFD